MSETAALDARAIDDATTVPSRWLAAAMVLTLVDAIATAVWIEAGIAAEANPLLAPIVESAGAVPAMLLRAAVGLVLLVLLGRLAAVSRLARFAVPPIALVLGGVAVWHATGLLHL